MRRPVYTLDMPFELSKKFAATQKKINERVGALETEWADHAKRSEELQQFELTPGAGAALAEAGKAHTTAKLNLLLKERLLRIEIDKFYADCESDLTAARDAAFQAHEAAKVDVRQKLISIGYIDEMPPGANWKSIEPGHIMHHPRVFAAKQHYQSLRDYQLSPLRTLNSDSLEIVNGVLNGIRKRMLQENLA